MTRTTLSRQAATLALTLLASATCVFGAVGPVHSSADVAVAAMARPAA